MTGGNYERLGCGRRVIITQSSADPASALGAYRSVWGIGFPGGYLGSAYAGRVCRRRGCWHIHVGSNSLRARRSFGPRCARSAERSALELDYLCRSPKRMERGRHRSSTTYCRMNSQDHGITLLSSRISLLICAIGKSLGTASNDHAAEVLYILVQLHISEQLRCAARE